MTKLTRNQTKTIQPKLKTYAEKKEARDEMLDQIAKFLEKGGKIKKIKQGETALQYGKTAKSRKELSDKGRSGAISARNKNKHQKP